MKNMDATNSADGRYPGPAAEFQIAEVLRPHGVKGAFHVNLFAGDPERLKGLGRFELVDPADDTHRLTVEVHPEDSRPHALILAVDAWTTPEEVREHHHWRIAIPRSEAQDLAENEYYLLDLVGLEARLPSGQAIGRVREAMTQTAQPVLVIGSEGEEDIYLPAVRALVSKVNLAEGVLVIDPPPGLIELYRPDFTYADRTGEGSAGDESPDADEGADASARELPDTDEDN